MVKTVLTIDGMACGMCESHVNDAIRNALRVKKVTSSHAKGETEILSEEPLSEEALHRVLDGTGYTITAIRSEPYEKKKFSLFGKKQIRQRKKGTAADGLCGSSFCHIPGGANPSVKNFVFATSPIRGGKWGCEILTWLP